MTLPNKRSWTLSPDRRTHLAKRPAWFRAERREQAAKTVALFQEQQVDKGEARLAGKRAKDGARLTLIRDRAEKRAVAEAKEKAKAQ